MKPSTTFLATSCRLPIRARTCGSMNPEPGIASELCRTLIASHPRLRRGHLAQQLVDQLVAAHPLRLSVEVPQDAVPQHGVRQRADVLDGDVVAAAHQRPRL